MSLSDRLGMFLRLGSMCARRCRSRLNDTPSDHSMSIQTMAKVVGDIEQANISEHDWDSLTGPAAGCLHPELRRGANQHGSKCVECCERVLYIPRRRKQNQQKGPTSGLAKHVAAQDMGEQVKTSDAKNKSKTPVTHKATW